MREINLIALHCAASKGDVSAATIRGWHVIERGWSDIGYHYVVRTSGLVETGRPLAKAGAHIAGKNKNSIGICIAGGYDGTTNDMTEAQWLALENLVRTLKSVYPAARVAGHNEFTTAKTCPNFDVAYWAQALDL